MARGPRSRTKGTKGGSAGRKTGAKAGKASKVAAGNTDAQVAAIVGPVSGARANPVQTRTLVNGFKGRVHKFKVAEGETAHEFGTQLAMLYRAAAHVLYGYDTFVAFVEAEFGIPSSSLYRYLAVAKYATAVQARWGIEAVLAAGRLVELLRGDAALRRVVGLAHEEPDTIAHIADVQFPMPGGGTLKLKGSGVAAADVRAVIAHLSAGPAPTGGIPLVLQRKNEEIAAACASDEALAGVRARYVRTRGKPTLRVEIPRDADVRAVFAALAGVLAD